MRVSLTKSDAGKGMLVMPDDDGVDNRKGASRDMSFLHFSSMFMQTLQPIKLLFTPDPNMLRTIYGGILTSN